MWKKTRLQPRVGTPSSRFITHPLAFIVFKAVVAFYILPSPTCSEGSLGLNSVFGFSTQFFIPLLHLTCDHRNLACGWESADGVRACVWVCVSVCVFGRRVCVSACLPSASCRDYITVCLEKHRRVSAVHMLGELKKKRKARRRRRKEVLNIFCPLGWKCVWQSTRGWLFVVNEKGQRKCNPLFECGVETGKENWGVVPADTTRRPMFHLLATRDQPSVGFVLKTATCCLF